LNQKEEAPSKLQDSKETEVLGLGYQEAWVRPEKKSDGSAKESEIWLRTLKQLGRPQKNWISIGDRGNDIYDSEIITVRKRKR
jgi:hypothetical protein